MKALAVKIISYLKKRAAVIYITAGSFMIVAGWNWYHVAYKPHWRFVAILLGSWAGVAAGYVVFRALYAHFTRRFNRLPFWQNEFKGFLDELFFLGSFLFLVFFSRSEFLSFVYVSALFALLFWRLQKYFVSHPFAFGWQTVNRSVFALGYFIFVVSGLLQYLAYRYYILDSEARIFNIVVFRAWAMTMFWLAGFAVAGMIYLHFRHWVRYVLTALWSLFFMFILVAWMFNIGILYFSGLYLSPVVLWHAEGAGSVMGNWLTWVLVPTFAFVIYLFIRVLRSHARALDLAPVKYWRFYNSVILLAAVGSILGLASFRNTPEWMIIKSFWNYFAGDSAEIKLSPVVAQKLEKFGLKYNTDEFYLARREKIYASDAKLLPAKFAKQKPNIVVVFLESFSTRLTSVYDDKLPNLTPGLEKMASDKHTTVFKKYYNSSTPTITGVMAQLCSFLVPTGHDEIEIQKKMQSHHLLCLPKILRDTAGYKYTGYVTAVDKSYAHKDTIFASMGVDHVFGTDELAKRIDGEPLAWGYSDHQMFPEFFKMMGEAPEPFFLSLSTVDTHPPFDMAKDQIKYPGADYNLFNSFYTTDDAFAKFWESFAASEFYDNTIVVAVADHAIFPTAYDKKYFPDIAGKMSFYDENAFLMYVPESVLPPTVDRYAMSIDFAPTLLQVLGVNTPNTFEGHSIFDDRVQYSDVLGMHEFGLYLNQEVEGKRQINYAFPNDLSCSEEESAGTTSTPLTLCEFLQYYRWKRQMYEEGRFWMK